MAANRGFKGTEVGLDKVLIAGSQAQVSVQFVNNETRQTHATMTHSIPLVGEGADPAIVKSAHDFLNAIRNHVARLHFTEPEVGEPIQEAARGISESLRGEADEPA